MTNTFEVLLFYKYVEIKNPVTLMRAQKRLCERLGLKGRIIISLEGINGTLEGSTNNTTQYIEEITKDIRFVDINFKKSVGDGNSFRKLSVKVRDEIVTTLIPNLTPWKFTGKHLSVHDLHLWFVEKREFYIVDMRNDYEYISGQFEGSILSGFSNFKDLPQVLEKLQHLKNKTIVTVCTGGVRCEKASAFLLTNGFLDVYQLENGIQTYMEQYPNEHFKGKLYVFDNRLTIGFNTDSPKHHVIGKCMHCNASCDRYVNCMNHRCHLHFICCNDCLDIDQNAYCSDNCRDIAHEAQRSIL